MWHLLVSKNSHFSLLYLVPICGYCDPLSTRASLKLFLYLYSTCHLSWILIHLSYIHFFATGSQWYCGCLLHLHHWNPSHPSPTRHLPYTSIISHKCRVTQTKHTQANKVQHTCINTQVTQMDSHPSSSACYSDTLGEKTHSSYKVTRTHTLEWFSPTAVSIIQPSSVMAAVTFCWLNLSLHSAVKSYCFSLCEQVGQVNLDN